MSKKFSATRLSLHTSAFTLDYTQRAMTPCAHCPTQPACLSVRGEEADRDYWYLDSSCKWSKQEGTFTCYPSIPITPPPIHQYSGSVLPPDPDPGSCLAYIEQNCRGCLCRSDAVQKKTNAIVPRVELCDHLWGEQTLESTYTHTNTHTQTHTHTETHTETHRHTHKHTHTHWCLDLSACDKAL